MKQRITYYVELYGMYAGALLLAGFVLKLFLSYRANKRLERLLSRNAQQPAKAELDPAIAKLLAVLEAKEELREQAALRNKIEQLDSKIEALLGSRQSKELIVADAVNKPEGENSETKK